MGGPVGFLFLFFLFSCIQLLGRKSKGKELPLLQLSLLTASMHLLDQQCSGSQIMPTLELLPELEDETSVIKTGFMLRCLTAFSLPQVLFCCCDVCFFKNLFIGGFFDLTKLKVLRFQLKFCFCQLHTSPEEIDSRTIALR